MFDAWKKTTGPGRGNYECTVDESAPIIASLEDDNTISINDSEIAEAREKSLDHYVKNKEFTRKIMDRYRLHDTNWMRAKSTGTPHFSIAAVLKIATDENILSESEALEVAKKQRDVMFRRINAAVDARISSQKQETSMLRKLMQEVDAYIENVKER
ncbi:hypothetical protein [Nitrospirillum pindoramense]|nr:hypothetical protein [Nitrospirillum amazonense]